MANDAHVEAETISNQQLGFPPGHWPQTFEHNARTWHKDDMLVAENGDVQYVTYTDKAGRWLVVWRD